MINIRREKCHFLFRSTFPGSKVLYETVDPAGDAFLELGSKFGFAFLLVGGGKLSDLIVDMGPGRSTGASGECDNGLSGNLHPGFYENLGVMAVQGDIPFAMLDSHQVAIPLVLSGKIDGPVLGRIDRCSRRNSDVPSVVHDHPAAAERVESQPRARGKHAAVHRRFALGKGSSCGKAEG